MLTVCALQGLTSVLLSDPWSLVLWCLADGKNGQQRTFLASWKANHHSSSATDWPNKCVCRQGFQTPPGQWSLGFTKWVANRSHKPSCWFGPRQHNKSYKSKRKVASGTLSKLVYSLRWQGKLESILHCQRHLEHGRTPERMEWHLHRQVVPIG